MVEKIIKFPSKTELKGNERVRIMLDNAEKGEYILFHFLGEMYKNGKVVKKDEKMAIKFYQRFCEEHLKKRVSIDLVQTYMDIGHLYMHGGNKYRAAEYYVKAALQIIGDYTICDMEKVMKRYKIKKHLQKTGYEELLINT